MIKPSPVRNLTEREKIKSRLLYWIELKSQATTPDEARKINSILPALYDASGL